MGIDKGSFPLIMPALIIQFNGNNNRRENATENERINARENATENSRETETEINNANHAIERLLYESAQSRDIYTYLPVWRRYFYSRSMQDISLSTIMTQYEHDLIPLFSIMICRNIFDYKTIDWSDVYEWSNFTNTR